MSSVQEILAKARTRVPRYLRRERLPNGRYRYFYHEDEAPHDPQHQALDRRDPNVRAFLEETGTRDTPALPKQARNKRRKIDLNAAPDVDPADHLDTSDPHVRAFLEETGRKRRAQPSQALSHDPRDYYQPMMLSMRVRRAGQGGEKPGHKYLRREWDAQAQRWQYTYTPGPALSPKDKLAAMKQKLAAGKERNDERRAQQALIPKVDPSSDENPPPLDDAMREKNDKGRPSDNPAAAPVVWDFELRTRHKKYESGAIVTATGDVLIEKRGGTNMVQWPKHEAAMMRGNILLHNHPEPYSFSPTDIITSLKCGIKEIRANTAQHRHSMVFPPTAGPNDIPLLEAMVAQATKTLQATLSVGAVDLKSFQKEGWHYVWTAVAREMGWQYTRDSWEDYGITGR